MSNFQSVGGLVDSAHYQDPPRVKYDLTEVARQFANLSPKMGTLIHNNGEESQQVILVGTVPIMYQNATYNIPVEIFVMLRHPVETPRVYVRPISTMMIKPGHSFVNPDGLVSTDHVLRASGTSYNAYSMVNFIYAMADLFGNEPPLFTKPKPKIYNGNVGGINTTNSVRSQSVGAGSRLQLNTPSQQQNGRRVSYENHGSSFSSSERYHAMGAQPAVQKCENDTEGCGGMNSTTTCGICMLKAMEERKPPVQFSDQASSASWKDSGKSSASHDSSKSLGDSSRRSSHASRGTMERMLTEKIQIALVSNFSEQREGLEKAMGESQELGDATAAMEGQFSELASIKETLEKGFVELQDKEKELNDLVVKMAETKVPIQDRLVPYDPLSAQMVRLAAERAAIEDTIYYLERALANSENPSVQVADFVKETRKLARSEFMKRSHLNKIAKAIAEADAAASNSNSNSKPVS